MDAKDYAQELRDLIANIRANGTESIPSENLIKYLDKVIPDLEAPSAMSAANLETHKANLQKWVEEHKHAYAHDLAHSVEMFRSVIQAGQNALRTAFLMNAGASVALLAFIGHLSGGSPHRVSSLAPSLTVFVSGVLIAALASGTTYMSQWFYAAHLSWQKTGFALNIAAIVLGIGAYAVFAVGMWRAYHVFASF